MSKIKIHKNEHPIFNFLKQKNEMFLFDTETTGLGTRDEPAEMVELYGIKYGLKKDLQIKILERLNKLCTIEVIFNNYKKTLKVHTTLDEKELKDYISNNGIRTLDGNFFKIKENTPFILDYKNNKESLMFNSIGDLVFLEEVDKLYKSRKPIELGAMVVHKIIDKEKIEKTQYLSLMDAYLEKYKDKENNAKLLTQLIEDFHILNKGKKILNEFEEKLNDSKREDLKIKYQEKISHIKSLLDASGTLESKKEKVFERFLKEFGFRENTNQPYFRDNQKEIDYISNLLNENIIRGHNVYNFDIKKILEKNGLDTIKNPLVIDTMHFDIQLGAKNVTNMDKLIKNYLKKELKNLRTEYKHLTNKIPESEELNTVNLIMDKWFNNDLDKEKVVDSIENLYDDEIIIVKEFFEKNKLDNFENFNYINKILTKKMERKTIHTAKLDIELNSFVIESQLKDYVNKYGFEDVLTEEKVVKNLIDVEPVEKIDEIEIKGYLGLKSDFSKSSSASASRIASKMKELGLNKFALSDDIFHNSYDNYKDFSKKGVENINVIEVIVKEYNIPVSIILPNPKSLDILPIINEMSIYKEDLEIAIKELGIFVAIPKALDKEFNDKNVFVKVEPYSLEEYENLNNKRVLWINNKYVENSNIEKGLNYMKKTRFNNVKTSPIEDNNRINLDKNYQDGHIPTKEELLNIFPYDNFKDIYENSNFILDNSKGFKPYRQNVKPLPRTTRLVDGLKENPETPDEYKKLMYNELRKAWETREMMNVVKKTAIKRYVENKKNYYSYLSNKQIKNLTKENIREANRFINEIDLGKLSSNKEKFYDFIEEEINNNSEFAEYVKEVKDEYTARIVYEVETLGNFGNYETVFNYYFQMRKILQTLEKNGIGHGPGRGSAAGSMLAYMLGITEVDPIPFNLLFERFMNPERVSEPDVDTDIPYGENITKEYVIDILNKEFSLKDKELKKLLVEENGFNEKIVDTMIKRNYSNYATKIATKIKSTNKTILSNYLRTRGLPQMALRNFLKEYNTDLSMEDNINIVNELNTPFLDSVKEDLEQLDDLLLSTGAHAGGVMIPNLPENALSLVVNGTSVFDKNIAEHETKWDLLGLKSMVLYFKLRMKKEKSLKTNQVEELNFNFNVLDDTNVFEVIQKGLNANIFQIESDGMKKMLKSLAPLDFETLIAALALYRPGPIEAGAVDAFITNKYIDLQRKYKRQLDLVLDGEEIQPGKISNRLTDKRYEKIKDKKFKQLVSPRLFNDIMNATSYFDSKTFKDNIRNGLATIVQRVKDGEVFDKEELEELKVLERDFVKFYNENNDIDESIKKTIEVASNLEKSIISSDLYMDITKETYGTIVYQEQIMSIATRISGFTKGGSDLLRKAVAKQKYEDLIKIKPELVKGMYDKLDKIDNKDVKIERNKEFETVVNYKGKEINFFNSKFNVENNKVVFNLTPDTKKLYEIYKSFGQEDADVKKLEEDLKNVSMEIKNNKDNSLMFELNSKKFKIQEELFNKMNKISDVVKPFIEKQFENIEIKDDEVKREKTFNKKVAEYLFDKIVGFGSYAFNKSHSASYRLLTYDFAFHKHYYPEKFYALSLEDSSLESAQRIFREITNTDINVKLMNVNKMNKDFDYDLKEKTITFSPMKIKSVKKQAIIAIYEELKRNGEFKSLMDLKNRIPKSLLDKKSILQLGNSGVLDELISPLTPKLFNEQFDNINSILDSKLEKNQKEFKDEIKNKDSEKYLKLINKIKKNEILQIQIAEYKNQADSLQKMFENDSIDKSETFTSEEDEQLVIGVREEKTSGVDDEELIKQIKENKDTLLELEKKLEFIPEEDIIFFNNFELKYSNEIKKTLKKDINIDEVIKELLSKIEIEEDVKTSKEFKEKIKNQENYTEEELNKVYMEVFAEYNFRKTVVNLDDKKIDREDMVNFIDTYYENVLKNLESKFPNDLNGIKKPDFYVGNTPKILFLSEVLPIDYQNVDKVKLNDVELIKEEKSFTDTNGKLINYVRFTDEDANEYKVLKIDVEIDGEKTDKRVLQKKNGKVWETIDENKNVVEIEFQNKILSYIDNMIKTSGNDNLTVDDFAIFSFYPTEKKKEVKAKVLKEPIYQLTLKKLLKDKNFEIPMMIVTGTEPIKKIKDIPSIKYNTDYYFPYTFNWLNTTEQKEKNLENSSLNITTVSFTEGAWNYSWSKDKVMVDKVNNINKGFLNIINNISGKEVDNKNVPVVSTEMNME